MTDYDGFNVGIPMDIDQAGDTLSVAIDAMRQEIAKASRYSNMVRNTLNEADVRGLSGENRYVLLSYRALIFAEYYYQLTRKIENLTP